MKVKLTFLLSLICVCAFAQENHLSVDADFLTRGEIRSGGLSSAAEPPRTPESDGISST